MLNTREVLDILPNKIQEILESCDLTYLQEIRIKLNKPIIIQVGENEKILKYATTIEDIKLIVKRISNYSIYAFEEEIKQGYITIKGGHRVGICGDCVLEGKNIKTIKNISSLNIRICREIIGCADVVFPFLFSMNYLLNTIIISPPKCGKTTMLRDIVRKLSDGTSNFKAMRVCIIDERSELGACYNGAPQLQVGIRTDILDNCPKSIGIMMAIRSMSPDVIVCDEIGTYADVESILTALNSGVSIITTIHGNNIEDLFNRVVFDEIIKNNVFKRAVILNGLNGVGNIDNIYDLTKREAIWRK
jgi:stage III sporulation protein AA